MLGLARFCPWGDIDFHAARGSDEGGDHDPTTATTPIKVPTNTNPPDRVGVAKRDVESTATVARTMPVLMSRA